ncbi:helicase-exonuclease AddAB subunit AddA [Romboutsia lituseburensis]|uniref:ATP-dependent helicase/nuclease subunit A n=1 Tax=Romboutsia lituseburensis DSM 797 TaxID=1121325 RepID=A0A1G9NP61_9FIRM|nr:helicase-exonuclease AddAB subunit AddA [Romboutsia lituseburensis]CEH33037.1 ATP-dependent helicase/nuclease subunit A [Romboutsia lituseburensis]SDL87785.1 DNA helicase/exodeoxyribonuclease V, subunit A [Romboutsia lituseburensis DSM 797]
MSSPKWTDEQQAVIDSRNCNLLVAAAAGSGKTAVLVERIIQMITDKDDPIDIDKLLVVTFTNAAASEMRERVGDAIGKALDKDPENKHLQSQLILLNKASITTIHSFCLEVIKSNFHKINLDPNFRIGDTTECTLLKQEAIEDVFEQLYVDRDKGFLNLVESYAEKRGDNNLQEIILSIYNFAMASPDPKQWLEFSSELFNIDDSFEFSSSIWAESILETVKIEISGMEVSMAKALEELEGIEELETYTDKFKSDYSGIKRILNGCNESWDKAFEAMLSMKFENYVKGVKRLAKDTPSYIRDIKDRADDIRKKVKKSVEDMKDSTFSQETGEIKDQIRYLYQVVKSISEVVIKFEEAYDARKREKGIIDFNDIEHFALKILTTKDEEGKDIPSDIALTYREKFYEIFIDEYQDSNLVQEVLLSTIAKIKTPNRFMVGDVKQSIYRFRQAKPEIFLQKYANYETEKGCLYRKIMLYKNFRSREEVVDCANYIFENVMSKNIGEIEYTEEERLNLGAVFKDNTNEEAIIGGPSEIHIMQTKAKSKDVEKSEEKEHDENEEQEEIDNIQLEARMVGKIIKDLRTPNENGQVQMIYDKKMDDYRPVQFKDIVILLRATSVWAPVFADELMNMDIPTYADIGVGYFDTIEIKTIMSLIQVIDNPMQDIPLLAVLKSPICGFTPEDLIDIRVEDGHKSFYEALEMFSQYEDERGKKCFEFIQRLNDYKEKSLYMSTDEFLWYLYTKTGYYAYVGALPGGSQRQANLKILFERAKQFEETSFKGIFNFINFVSKLKKSNTDMGSAKTLGENADVVRIMSIHKSKGLEFPVVICSGMGKNFNTQDFKKNILYHHNLGYGPQIVDYERKISYPSIAKEALKSKINIENLSEEMRVLYVAFTRPKEKLIITGSTRNIEKSLRTWENGVEGNKPISQYKVLKGKTFLDWIMPSVLKHKDLENLREAAEIDLDSIDNHKSKWLGKLWFKEDVILEAKEEEEKENISDVLLNINLEQPDTQYYDVIKDKLDFKYPCQACITKPASISVTEIKKIQNAHEEDDSSANMFNNNQITLKKPLFMQESEDKEKITGAERGTIIHLIMEIIDFNKINTIDEIKEQINSFIKKEIITEKQATVVNPFKIYKFFKSGLGKRMLAAKFIKREQAIYTQIKLKDVYVYEDLVMDENSEMYDDESIMLRGIIDAYFEEDDKLVLVDYKTDFVNDENKEEVVNRYKKQLDLYCDVLKELTGKEVKEKYIYLFGIDEDISI